MNRKTLFFLILVCVLLAILVKCPRDCEEQTIPTDPIRSKVDTLTTEIKAIQAIQDTNASKVKVLEAKSKELPRIKDLRPKPKRDTVVIRDTVWITETHGCDTLYKVALEKELVLDSLLELTNRLVTFGLLERKKHEEKDSLNNELILSLNNKLDSAKTSKRRYWRGVKHGVVAGYVLGTATAIIAK